MGDLGLIPGLGRSPGEGNGNSLQYSCQKIPWMEERGGLQLWGKELDVTEQFHSLILIKYNIDKKLNTSCMHILVNNY